MKIHAFKVTSTGDAGLEEIVRSIAAKPLEGRLKHVGPSPIRIEDFKSHRDFLFIDFAAINHEGPGKASYTGPIEDFDLDDTEGFGHETALCYSRTNGVAVLQYNHFGPRIGRIQSYLYACTGEFAGSNGDPVGGFVFDPVLKSEAVTRLNEMTLVKRLDVAVYVPGIMASRDIDKMSLGKLLSNPVIGGSERVKFSISAGRGRGSTLDLTNVKRIASELLGLKDEVSELSITAREDEDGPSEPLDLLNARLEADIPVTRSGRRYPRDGRFAALEQALNAWISNGQLA